MDAGVPSATARRARVLDVVLGAIAAAAALAVLAIDGRWPPGAVAIVACAACAPALARIDLAERRLPNVMTLPLLALGALAGIATAIAGDWGAPLVALAVAALLLLLALPGGMGMGDVKLGAALALAIAPLAWWLPLAGLAASFVLGGIVGLIERVRGNRTLPFGPWLLAGHAVALVALLLVREP